MAQLLWVLTAFPLFYLLGGFSSLLVFVGCLYALNESKQAWHDQWARTAVFRRRHVRALAPAGRVVPEKISRG